MIKAVKPLIPNPGSLSREEYLQTVQAYQRLLEDNYTLRHQLQDAHQRVEKLSLQLGQTERTLQMQNQLLLQQEESATQWKLGAEALAAEVEERNIQIAWMQSGVNQDYAC